MVSEQICSVIHGPNTSEIPNQTQEFNQQNLQCGAPPVMWTLVYKPHEYYSYKMLFAYHKP